MDRLNVTNERWDYLIILDACRYDYFEQVYRQYLKGDLAKKMSAGTCTNEWRDKSFPDYYDDIIYISANPQICATSKVYGYCAGEHFHAVHEVWNDQWDKEMGTVLPETLTNAAVRIISETAGQGKRYIIHYLQPHAPYVSLGSELRGYIRGDINETRRLVGADGNKPISQFKHALLRQLLRLFRRNDVFLGQPEWYLRKLLAMPPTNPMEAALRSVGREMLRKAYRDNLTAALKQVAVLIESLSGSIVITSDHGELLGERLCYGHPRGRRNPILITVPWLVIENESPTGEEEKEIPADDTKQAPEAQADTGKEAEQKELVKKLKALGYYD